MQRIDEVRELAEQCVALRAEVARLREALREIAKMTEHVQYGPESSINSVAMCAISPASEGTRP